MSQLIGAANSGLGRLATEARKRADLTEHLRGNLTAPLGDGLRHCDIRPDGTLIVAAINPEWAAKLRFAERELLQLCNQTGAQAHSVKVTVAG